MLGTAAASASEIDIIKRTMSVQHVSSHFQRPSTASYCQEWRHQKQKGPLCFTTHVRSRQQPEEVEVMEKGAVVLC